MKNSLKRLVSGIACAALTIGLTLSAQAAEAPPIRVSSYKGATLEVGERSGLIIGPKVKIKLVKLDDGDTPLPGAVFNIIKDGQIIGTEATKADGSITVTDVTEGMYAFVEVSAPTPYATLTDPVIAHVDQATINGGGTVTVTASDKRLPSLTILKRDAQTKEIIPGTVFEINPQKYCSPHRRRQQPDF